MNIEVLKAFCDLVDSGSFSKAADANYVTQSAISQQLAKLERTLSTQLISRGGGLVVPTEAGRTLYNGAREIIRRYEQLLGEVRSASDAIRGVLRVGTIYSVGFFLLAPFVRKFLKAHPEVNLHVEYTRWSNVYGAVLSGEMDLGIVACAERHRSIEIIPFANEQMGVVCAPTHPLARRKAVEPSDLDGEMYIAFEQNIPTQRLIDRLFKAEGVQVKTASQFDNIELLKRAVEVGAGITVLPLDNIERERVDGHLVAIPFRKPAKWYRPISILRRRGKAPGPAERMFLDILDTKPSA